MNFGPRLYDQSNHSDRLLVKSQDDTDTFRPIRTLLPRSAVCLLLMYGECHGMPQAIELRVPACIEAMHVLLPLTLSTLQKHVSSLTPRFHVHYDVQRL